MRTTLVSLCLLAACGDNGGALPDAPRIDAQPIDANVVERTKTVMLTGGANGLMFDAANKTLYLTDNNTDALLKYTDAGGIATVGTLPAGSAGISLGDIVHRSDGTILVTNFGFGTQGAYFSMATNNTSKALTGPAVNRRRIGLSQDSAGTLYVAYFVGGGGGAQTGGVSSVAISGDTATETDIATATVFKKLVGIVATPTAVYVSDQTDKLIYKIAIPAGTVTTLATVPSADLLAVMPNGDLLTGGTGVHRITPTGTVTTILTGEFEQVRGMAYDAANKRLFIIDHSATPGTPDKLQIRPLDN
jgi:hypothetical protein